MPITGELMLLPTLVFEEAGLDAKVTGLASTTHSILLAVEK